MPMASMWVAIMMEGRSDLPEPRFKPCREPNFERLTSSTSGDHLSRINCMTGLSYAESPGAESMDFRNGRISVI